MSGYTIRPDDLTGEAITALIIEHLTQMNAISPREAVHALGTDGLRHPGISFWSLWQGETLVGCGALKALGDGTGEIKSMRTRPAFQRQGAGKAMLAHILAEARARGYSALFLETGSTEHFVPARRMYEAAGFVPCGRFGDYPEHPHSHFMMLAL